MDDLIREHFGTIIVTAGVVIIVIVAIIRGVISELKAGAFRVLFKGKETKALKLSNLNKILDNQILDLDGKMIDFVILQADKFRRDLLHFFNSYLKHPSAKRVISSAIRHPLYNAARRNRFNKVLCPSNTKDYVNNLMSEIKLEYADVNVEQAYFQCPVHGGACIDYPAWDAFKDELRELLIKEWINPVREHRIKISQDKIALYEQYIIAYGDLGDENRIIITQQCVDKNKEYIAALKDKVDE